MMNRSSNTSDSYVPSIVSFVGLEATTNPLIPTHQKSQLWDPSIPFANSIPFFDSSSPPSHLLPNFTNFSSSSSFYSPFPSDLYHHHPAANIIKREEGGRIGLNLGHRTYFSSGDALTIDRLLTARAHHQPPRCQAEGCKADLSGAKHYHRRHKVCEFHSKATVVVAGGLQQRFCQQCSRFHVLAEFDEAKRSCRKRLADHNRRRRKPQNPSTTNSNEKIKQTPKSSPTNKTSTTATTSSAADSGLEGEHDNKAATMRINYHEPAALSLGGFGGSHQSLYNNYQNFSPNSTNSSNGNFFYHQSLFGSSSNEPSQSTEAGSDQHQSNLVHDLGQAMFEL